MEKKLSVLLGSRMDHLSEPSICWGVKNSWKAFPKFCYCCFISSSPMNLLICSLLPVRLGWPRETWLIFYSQRPNVYFLVKIHVFASSCLFRQYSLSQIRKTRMCLLRTHSDFTFYIHFSLEILFSKFFNFQLCPVRKF